MKYSRVVCVLSGGGAKSAGHLGAVRALEERGLGASHYVGASMGAVIGACFASGLPYEEVLRRVTAISRKDVARPAPGVLLGPFGKSLLRPKPLADTIARLVTAERFEDLRTPLSVTAVDAATGERVVFGAGGRVDVSLHEALYASCALPVYYPPARIGGRAYLDGGVRGPLPLDVARARNADLVFAVYVGPSFQEQGERRVATPTLLGAHNNAMRIMMAAQAEAAVAAWDDRVPLVLVRPGVEASATFAVDRAVRYVEDGYRAAVRALEAWSMQE